MKSPEKKFPPDLTEPILKQFHETPSGPGDHHVQITPVSRTQRRAKRNRRTRRRLVIATTIAVAASVAVLFWVGPNFKGAVDFALSDPAEPAPNGLDDDNVFAKADSTSPAPADSSSRGTTSAPSNPVVAVAQTNNPATVGQPESRGETKGAIVLYGVENSPTKAAWPSTAVDSVMISPLRPNRSGWFLARSIATSSDTGNPQVSSRPIEQLIRIRPVASPWHWESRYPPRHFPRMNRSRSE